MEKLFNWFLDSDLYDDNTGAYRVFYSKGKLGPIYPEITAYAVSLACILFRESNDPRFLQRAKDCAEYLTGLSEHGLVGPWDNFEYLFDTGIFVSGLFDLAEATGSERYVDEAHKRLEWICSYFNGKTFPPIAGHKDGEGWDAVSSVHLVKLAIPLLKGWDILGGESYRTMAEQVLDWTADLQTEEGRFKINHYNSNTCLHPHCYATEGFLFASEHINEKRYWQIARKAGDWLAKIQNKNGSFPQWLPKYPDKTIVKKILRKFVQVESIDVTSQAIRIWNLLGTHEENIRRAETFLQNANNDVGLPLTKKKLWATEIGPKMIYSWPTFFYMHSKLIRFRESAKRLEIF